MSLLSVSTGLEQRWIGLEKAPHQEIQSIHGTGHILMIRWGQLLLIQSKKPLLWECRYMGPSLYSQNYMVFSRTHTRKRTGSLHPSLHRHQKREGIVQMSKPFSLSFSATCGCCSPAEFCKVFLGRLWSCFRVLSFFKKHCFLLAIFPGVLLGFPEAFRPTDLKDPAHLCLLCEVFLQCKFNHDQIYG